MNTAYSLFLASASPRRATLLEQLGLKFETLVCDIDETVLNGEKPMSYAKRMALWKAMSALKKVDVENCLIISADTSVVLNDRVLIKPIDFENFSETMQALSSKTHQVYTSVFITNGKQRESVVSVSDVSFRKISPDEIKAYWNSGEPLDKAGGYAIQGLGAIFVSQIAGSYSGVMGLPLFETSIMLKKFGIAIL